MDISGQAHSIVQQIKNLKGREIHLLNEKPGPTVLVILDEGNETIQVIDRDSVEKDIETLRQCGFLRYKGNGSHGEKYYYVSEHY